MRRVVVPLLALPVAFVLADSAVVTLALPDILARLGGTVARVAWVLIAFNLVLALAVVPAARWTTNRDPALFAAPGIVLFAAGSAWCAVAGSIPELIAARCGQALGGAFVLVGCLELLVAAAGERRGVSLWIVAGVVGTAAGPCAGGLLTEAFGWRAIFVVQVPVAVLALPAVLAGRGGRAPATDRHPPAIGPNVALALLSAALTAALLLLVLLLVDGWRRSPATAALTVSVVPLAALLARPLVRPLLARLPTTAALETATGCLLVAGGLVGLALPPSADLAWTVAPQALVGLGLGLTLDRLSLAAMRERYPRVLHGGWTIGARHIGVVLGLAILTPVFTADLRTAQGQAEAAITRLVLDAPIPAPSKVAVANGLAGQLAKERGQVPDLRPAFARLPVSAAQRPAAAQLERDLNDQVARAASRAFRTAFLIGAGLALAALVSSVPLRPRSRT